MDDLVERLTNVIQMMADTGQDPILELECLDEIERLRDQIEHLELALRLAWESADQEEELRDALTKLSPWRRYRGESVCRLCDGRANAVAASMGGHADDCLWLTAHRLPVLTDQEEK